MARVFRVASGKVAIWDNEADDNPFTNPTANLSRVRFHSDLDYTRIIDRQVISVTFPAYASGADYRTTQNIYAHGITGEPRVRGNITVSGNKLSLGCHIPIQRAGSTNACRFAILGATSSQVVVTDYANLFGVASSLAAIAFDITVEITNELN